MAPKNPQKSKEQEESAERKVNLRELAEHLGLSVATVSLVMNRSPAAKSIPSQTQARVLAAARELNYRPNVMARMLRQQRTFTVGVIVPEIGEGYAATVLAGVEDLLLQEGYFYFVVSHRHREDLIDEYPKLLQQRGVEGLIVLNTTLRSATSMPVVAVSGHKQVPGVTNITLNHTRAARLALDHLAELGHQRIAFIRGQDFSTDSDARWKAVRAVAQEMELPIDDALVDQLQGDLPTPEPGYLSTCRLLQTGRPFSALFAFNDLSALGAFRAIREARKRVPEDISVVGFDDIQGAAYQNPGVTTIRQPLQDMGKMAAEMLLKRITLPRSAEYPRSVMVEPELIVRGSTAKAPH